MSSETEIRPFRVDMPDEAIADLREVGHGTVRGSQVGSHRRPTPGHMKPIRAFDSLALPGTQTQLDTSADARNLVRIERVRVQIPLAPPSSCELGDLFDFRLLAWE
jgi:hypothetical protein